MFRLPRLSRIARLRLLVQGGFTLFCLYIGYQMYAHFLWAIGKAELFTPKPPAVEGFLPIAALLSTKRLYMTGEWDMIHPAGLTIFLAALLMAFLFRKGFCGWICPVGFVSNLMTRTGQALHVQVPVRGKLEWLLWLPKYVILGGFVYVVLFTMDIHAIEAFAKGPYNFVADSKMLMFFLAPSNTTLLVVAGLCIFAIVVRNAWCRFLCPYGALLGIFAFLSPVHIQRNLNACTQCGKCTTTCPSGIAVHAKQRVHSPECIGCAECAGSCPVSHCLTMQAASIRVPLWTAGAGAVLTLLGMYLWAQATGHWTADIPPAMVRRFHMLFFGM